MVDHNRIVALKQRRGIFAAFGQTEKVKAVDAEIARMRAVDDPEQPEPQPETEAEPEEESQDPEPAPVPAVETAAADLTEVETAAVSRQRRSPRG